MSRPFESAHRLVAMRANRSALVCLLIHEIVESDHLLAQLTPMLTIEQWNALHAVLTEQDDRLGDAFADMACAVTIEPPGGEPFPNPKSEIRNPQSNE